MSDLYDRDVAAWATEQAQALRARSTDTLDWDNLAAEIADVRKRYKDQIENRLITLCAHLLKWQFQPEMRSNSWRGAVVRSRDRIARLAAKMPTLAPYPAAVLAEVYPAGRPPR
jgi:hypothetical protein